MATDLVSACVFCAGLLFGIGGPRLAGVRRGRRLLVRHRGARNGPPNGRRTSPTSRRSSFSSASAAREAAGRPRRRNAGAEWRVRVALAPSHDEQDPDALLDRRTSPRRGPAGTRTSPSSCGCPPVARELDRGRLGPPRRTRRPISCISAASGSSSARSARCRPSGSTSASAGGTAGRASRPRSSLRAYVKPSGEHRARRRRSASREDWIYGGGGRDSRIAAAPGPVGERRARRRARSTSTKRAPRISSLRHLSPRVGRGVPGRRAIYGRGRTDALVSGTWDRSRLPFVSFAPLGVETAAFGEGHPPGVVARGRSSPSVSVRAGRPRASGCALPPPGLRQTRPSCSPIPTGARPDRGSR